MEKRVIHKMPAGLCVGLVLVAAGLLVDLQPAFAQGPTGCTTGLRYEDRGDGTVLDCNTGLYWLKNAACLTGGVWSAAQTKAATLSSGKCGLTDGSKEGDWRLPTKEEFCSTGVASTCPPANASNSLVKSGCTPATVSDKAGTGCWASGNPFVGVQQGTVYGYWSSTEADSLNAWSAFLTSGGVGPKPKGATFFTWPVRGPLSQPSSDKLVFATSAKCFGDLGACASRLGIQSGVTGIEAGDAICNKLAAAAGLQGRRFLAWLSDPTTNAKDRLDASAGPYANRKGERLGDNLETILDQGMATGVKYSELGERVIANAWTGTTRAGLLLEGRSHCDGWSSSAADGTANGSTGTVSGSTSWTHFGAANCGLVENNLYCFQM